MWYAVISRIMRVISIVRLLAIIGVGLLGPTAMSG